MPKRKKPPGKPRGPKPERLKLRGPMNAAVKTFLSTKRPAGGWPKAERYKPRATSEEE